MSSTEQLELDRETIGRVDPTDQLTDVLAIPEHLRDALWKVESAGLEPWDSAGGLVVAGMGGSAIGGRLARAILGDHASRPLLGVARLRPAAVDDAGHDGAVRQLLGRHRGDARLLRGGRRARRQARGRVTSGGQLAELARADRRARRSRSPAASSRAPRSPT